MPQNFWWVVSAWAIIFGGILGYGIAQFGRQKRLQEELARVRKTR